MRKHKELFIALLAFLIYFSYNILVNAIFSWLNIDLHSLSNFKLNIILIVSDLIIFSILFLIYRKEVINDFKLFIANKGKWFFKYLLIFIGSIILMGIANIIMSKITNMDTSQNEELVRKYIKLFPIYMGLSSIVYAPFMEELLFRKGIRKIVSGDDRIIKIAYILISAIAFGLMHVVTLDATFNDLLMGIPYMIAGLSFAYIYVKTDNLFATLEFHLMHNAILFILQILIK